MSTTFCFPDMFAPHISGSRLVCPHDWENYSHEDFPHFHVFMSVHVGALIEVGALEANANLIADLSEECVKEVTVNDLFNLGLVLGDSTHII